MSFWQAFLEVKFFLFFFRRSKTNMQLWKRKVSSKPPAPTSLNAYMPKLKEERAL